MWCLFCDLSTWGLIVVFSVVLCCLPNPDMVDYYGLKIDMSVFVQKCRVVVEVECVVVQ